MIMQLHGGKHGIQPNLSPPGHQESLQRLYWVFLANTQDMIDVHGNQPPLLKCLDYLNFTLPETELADIHPLPENSLANTPSREKKSPTLGK
jgi:hypothetical protein